MSCGSIRGAFQGFRATNTIGPSPTCGAATSMSAPGIEPAFLGRGFIWVSGDPVDRQHSELIQINARDAIELIIEV